VAWRVQFNTLIDVDRVDGRARQLRPTQREEDAGWRQQSYGGTHMQLMRRRESWDPFREMEELSSRFNRLFGLTRGTSDGERELLAATDWAPSCDISETDKEYRLQLELPNVKREDVHVTLEQGVLTVQGERREDKQEEGTRYHRRELACGTFLRRFTMPDDADEEKVEASFKDGILHIVIAKAQERARKAKEIAVH
jgi:HSP20 family protein